MNAFTQTPRRLYETETDRVLQSLTVKLENLERELQKRNSTRNKNSKTNGRQLVRREASDQNWNSKQNKMQIGPNGTKLSSKMYLRIDLTSYRNATRDLCYMIFGRETLGTHTLSGRVGPGAVHNNMKTKEQLEPDLVEDIVHYIMSKFEVQQNQVLHAIRLACRNSARTLMERKKDK